MAARIAGNPAQIRDALEALAHEPWPAPAAAPDLLAIGAMGGSAMAAELLAALESDRLPRPLLVVRDYQWPACVTARSLVLLCSYSGNTEETLSLYRAAVERGIPRLALATGGTLAAWCARDGVPCVTLPGGAPPRAALFSSWVRISHLPVALGWTGSPAADWEEAAAVLDRLNESIGPGVPEDRNPAKRLARSLFGRGVRVYGSGGGVAAAVTRWRHQLNENAKLPAHSAVVPELNHNEIVSWENAPALGGRPAVVILRDADAPPEHRVRLTLTAEYAERQGAGRHEVESSGTSRLARVASLVHWGDTVSLYLALLHGDDPTPIASIDEFKRRLAEPGTAR